MNWARSVVDVMLGYRWSKNLGDSLIQSFHLANVVKLVAQLLILLAILKAVATHQIKLPHMILVTSLTCSHPYQTVLISCGALGPEPSKFSV